LTTAAALILVPASRIIGDRARTLPVFFSLSAIIFGLVALVKSIHPVAGLVLALGSARILLQLFDRNRGRLLRIVLPISAIFALGLAIESRVRLGPSESGSSTAHSSIDRSRPNLVLVVMDTVRGDRLGSSGYRRATTPNLDRLALRGVLFREARSTAPWTLPSHASMFTGRLPHQLGMSGSKPLPSDVPTLAETLSDHGYRTGGFVGNTYFCNSWYGLGRGFQHYEDYYRDNLVISPYEALRCSGLGRAILTAIVGEGNARSGTINALKDASRVNGDFLDWLDRSGDRPFFVFLNYIDTHDPYQAHDTAYARFGRAPESPEEQELIRSWHAFDKTRVDESALELLEDCYDDSLRALDARLGELFEELKLRKQIDNTYVVITSDHGEAFGEHGLYLHGQSLHRNETHVPLIIWGPHGVPAARSIDRPVSLVDLAATALELLDIDSSDRLPGKSWSRLWQTDDDSAVSSDPVISEAAVREKPSGRKNAIPAMRGPMVSVIEDGYVLIRDAHGSEQMFNVESDPGERLDLIARDDLKHVRVRLRTRLNEITASSSRETTRR
jgi:arylsulfatase A-like enzyme